MLSETLEKDFFEGRRSSALPFCVNDEVQVVSGVYAGRRGAVILLDRSQNEVRFLVDFKDGTDELFGAANLRISEAAV